MKRDSQIENGKYIANAPRNKWIIERRSVSKYGTVEITSKPSGKIEGD